MRHILRETLFLVWFLAAWYILALVVSYALYPDYKSDIIDTKESDKTIFQTSERYIIFALPKILSSPKKKIFFIGASNVRDGFRPKELQSVLPEYEVHNLAVSGSNITEMHDVVNILQLLPEDLMKKSVFVIGIWYGSFVDDEKHWGTANSSVITEALRYGLYRLDSGKPKLRVKMDYLSYATVLLRPCLFLQRLITKVYVYGDRLRTFAHNLLRKKRIDFSAVFNPRRPGLDEAYKRVALRRWQDFMGTKNGSFKDEQFEKFLDLSKLVNKSGAMLLIVDMPLPEWHRRGSPYWRNYQKKKNYYINEALKLGNVRYVDLELEIEDKDFRDSVHPQPEVTKQWGILLKTYIYQDEHRSTTL
ncbi:MAG: hypothetical protein NG740_05515 [Omnitrophica bacterium]|nr:hypothetical protein [Candidatus Omnitrophota bacterium]